MRPRRAVAAGVVLLTCVGGSALATVSATSSHAAAAHAPSRHSFTKTEKVSRSFITNGKSHVVDRRTVTLKVNQTTNLRGRQEIGVSWSGAHPTGGIVSDQNASDAEQEEYPFVLLECRGVDSTKVKPALRLSQKTCWTQNWTERYQDSYNTAFPPFRLDRYATTADRAEVVGAPKKLPKACEDLPGPVQHWVPFDAVDGSVYYGGPNGCAGQAPESQSVGGAALPSNETFGVTGRNGHGSTKFDVLTDEEYASLGCSDKVACSLVAVPIEGISCDPQAAGLPKRDRPRHFELKQDTADCESTGNFKAGQLVTPQNQEALSVSGSLWWSESNWRNRIVVPLSFAVPADACNVVNTSSNINIFGSELLTQATGQWAPHFCLNSKSFKFTHVQLGEPEARLLLASGGTGAFTSDPQPGGYGKPVVNAPVAATGFSISYVIDGANGQPYTHLRLDPRLLAKLLTESYPAVLPVQQEDKALANNPLNITLDPEFQKLNPGITHGVGATQAASTLLALSSDSDVMEALTTYINDNPAARAWLNGKPDPWGMVVNPAYKHIKLPVDRWQLLSTFEPKKYYKSDTNDCLFNTPVPYLPLVAAPMASIFDISQALQFAEAQSTTTCSQVDGTTLGEKLVPQGRQTVGFRFMIGISSAADAARYQLRSAALESSNNHYVTPTNASMRAAVSFLKPDKKTGTWPIPYETLRTSKAAKAYPGTMLVYTAVPTTGLSPTEASDYAKFLQYVTTKGQKPGLQVGELPPGYLPLSKKNGLATEANYGYAASIAVQAQKGAQPKLTGNRTAGYPPPVTTSPTPTPVATQPSTVTPPIKTPPSTTTVTTPPPVKPTVAAAAPTTRSVALKRTLGIGLGGGSLVVLIVAGLALLGGLGAPLVYVVGRQRGRW